jgi:hypothetical protein
MARTVFSAAETVHHDPTARASSPCVRPREPEHPMRKTTHIVRFSLPQSDVEPLFPFTPKGISPTDCIQLCLNQTLIRDGFYGAWAQIQARDASYEFTIASPDPKADLTPYATVYPRWLAAVRTGLAAYTKVYSKLHPKPPAPPAEKGLAFLPPFGLAMINTRSVQLLHYPPQETLEYMDYLYSPTNRRWESLLAYNGSGGAQNTRLETITDLVPIAANGGDSGAGALAPFMNPYAFAEYVPEMLDVFLRPVARGRATQPVVAYGGPVLETLESLFHPKDISPITKNKRGEQGKLQAMSLFRQRLVKDGPETPVLCTNHPSLFMYYPQTSAKYPTDYREVLRQDLTAARWQLRMSARPGADPVATLNVDFAPRLTS